MADFKRHLNYKPVELRFGTSGLRGLVKDMTDLECYINALGFMHYLRDEDGVDLGSQVYLAGDLRESTPRLMRVMQKAIHDAGFDVVNCGMIPTPAVAFYAMSKGAPSVMVTGSHIPADRNGIKFYKSAGEVLKADEPLIKQAVKLVREQICGNDFEGCGFDSDGRAIKLPSLSKVERAAEKMFVDRYLSVFAGRKLSDKKVVLYQHSAVGRDMLEKVLLGLGADVVAIDRSDEFVPIDTENVTEANRAYFKKVANEHGDIFAIVSTDGDSDRPFVVDANGEFHRGDVLGAVVASWLNVDFVVYPVSASDAVDKYMAKNGVKYEHTKIGSPYVIEAMKRAEVDGFRRVLGWEVNGGVLLGGDLKLFDGEMKMLETRDAFLPIIAALLSATESGCSVAELFAKMPRRYTQSGLIDNVDISKAQMLVEWISDGSSEATSVIKRYFDAGAGFGKIIKIDDLDGARVYFDNGDIVHVRGSGNAPQLRVYSVADSQLRADEIVEMSLGDDGILMKMLSQAL